MPPSLLQEDINTGHWVGIKERELIESVEVNAKPNRAIGLGDEHGLTVPQAGGFLNNSQLEHSLYLLSPRPPSGPRGWA